MPEIIIVLALLVVIYVVVLSISYQQTKRVRLEVIETLKKYGELVLENKRTLLKIKEQTFEILFYKIRKNDELTINSTTMWEVHRSGGSFLINQSQFLASPYPKIVIVYPIETQIKRYINENELVFIDEKDVFYQIRVVKKNQLENVLQELSL